MRYLGRVALSVGALCAVAAALGSGQGPAATGAARPAPDVAAAARGSARPLAWLRPRADSEPAPAPRARVTAGTPREAGSPDASAGLAAAPPRVVAPLTLDPPELAEGALAVRVRGFDPAAPRPLWLWRVGPERAAVAARGRSRPDGELVFPPLVIPSQGLRLVAAPAGSGPEAPAASLPREIPPPAPPPPRALLLGAEDGAIRVRVEPALGGGTLLVAAPDGALLGRYPVPAHADAARRGFELDLVLGEGDDHVLLAHAGPDGRRSAWQRLGLRAPAEITLEEGEEKHAD